MPDAPKSPETVIPVYIKIAWYYNYRENAYEPSFKSASDSPPPSSAAESVVRFDLTIPEGFYATRFPTVKAEAPMKEISSGVGTVPDDVHVTFPE